jgi:polar amino acid transport system substrate-binding protein
VACAGAEYAVHAEYVVVPENLCVLVPQGLDLDLSSSATLGAIALQGVRRAGVTVGEHAVVIGLGILGLICCEILQAAGVKVVGVDIDEASVAKARSLGHTAFVRSDVGLEDQSHSLTAGLGFDAAIITASSSSNDPALLAGRLIRKRGRIVVVGAFKLEFDRQPLYEKEAQILMSTSYGPGRYDSEYEEKGLSYPRDLVRWSQRENIEGFMQLLAQGKVRMAELISHRFPIGEALSAYAMITGERPEPYTGVLITYDPGQQAPLQTAKPSLPLVDPSQPQIGFIGAGNFAQSHLLPALKKAKVPLLGVTCKHPASASSVAKRFRIQAAYGGEDELLAQTDINTVFIVTRHDLHGAQVLKALRSQRHVFVEKPLCLNRSELHEILEHVRGAQRMPLLMVGFNRRFSPALTHVKQQLDPYDRVVMTLTVNAGPLPADHWLLDPEVGGGRIIGEFCHFVDLCEFFLGPIASVTARGLPSVNGGVEDLSVTVMAQKGMASITYTAQGNMRHPKERLEFFAGNQVWTVDNFRSVRHSPSGRSRSFKGKGIEQEISAFLEGIRTGQAPIPLDVLLRGMDMTLQIQEQVSGQHG